MYKHCSVLGLSVFLLSSCASTEPRYEGRWYHPTMNQNERRLAVTMCRLERQEAINEFNRANPDSSTDSLGNLGNSVGRYNLSSTAYEACMLGSGFSWQQICVSNCDQFSSAVGTWALLVETPSGPMQGQLAITDDRTGTFSIEDLGELLVHSVDVKADTILFEINTSNSASPFWRFQGKISDDIINGGLHSYNSEDEVLSVIGRRTDN